MKTTIENAIKIAIVLCDMVNNTSAVLPRGVREALVEALDKLEGMKE